MRRLCEAPPDIFKNVRFVLTDMDETLTLDGRLYARTYAALERLRDAGVTVIPVTAAPTGWCDQMARMWPVDGVIGENGGCFFQRTPDGRGVRRMFWDDDQAVCAARRRELARIAEKVQAETGAAFADDQPFRLTSAGFAKPDDPAARTAISTALRRHGADTTVNNLWVLGWLGGYDKLAMARKVLATRFDLDIDRNGDAVLYSGDSANDAPMFGFFRHAVGVSTVVEHLADIPIPPAWIADGPGGDGFIEIAQAVLKSRPQPSCKRTSNSII